MKDFFTIFIIVSLVLLSFTGIALVGDEAVEKNPNLNQESKLLIIGIDASVTETSEGFEVRNVSGTNLGQDAFVQQYLESKENVGRIQDTVDKVGRIPDFFTLSWGVSEEDSAPYMLYVGIFFSVILIIAGFRAFFGPGRITNK